jgi:hypothetical protein
MSRRWARVGIAADALDVHTMGTVGIAADALDFVST